MKPTPPSHIITQSGHWTVRRPTIPPASRIRRTYV